MTLLYRFETTTRPVQRMRLKVEINTREHFAVLGWHPRRFEVQNPWFSGSADLTLYQIEELLGTKLRALYQRRKGRDLYDLWLALTALPIRAERVVECFERYLEHGGVTISRAELEANLHDKLRSPAFCEDIAPLLPAAAHYDVAEAAAMVHERLITRLRGDPWKGEENPTGP